MYPSSSSAKSSSALTSATTSPRNGGTGAGTGSTKSRAVGARNVQGGIRTHSGSAAWRSNRNSFETQQSHGSNISSLTANTASSSAITTTTTTAMRTSSSLHIQVSSSLSTKEQGKSMTTKDGKIGRIAAKQMLNPTHQSNPLQTHAPHTPTPPKPTRARRFSIMASPVLKGNTFLCAPLSSTSSHTHPFLTLFLINICIFF